jgi:hypothetical protein
MGVPPGKLSVLRIVVIVNGFGDIRVISRQRTVVTGFSQAKMLQNLFDDLIVLDEGDDPNPATAFLTFQRINILLLILQP